jgi:hypothetical protein
MHHNSAFAQVCFTKEQAMFHRIGTAALLAATLLVVPGCVEMTQIITLNPNGRGKVVQDVQIAAFSVDLDSLQPGAQAKEKSFDEIKMKPPSTLSPGPRA